MFESMGRVPLRKRESEPEGDSNDKILLESKTHRAILTTEWRGDRKVWLLTFYQNKSEGRSGGVVGGPGLGPNRPAPLSGSSASSSGGSPVVSGARAAKHSSPGDDSSVALEPLFRKPPTLPFRTRAHILVGTMGAPTKSKKPAAAPKAPATKKNAPAAKRKHVATARESAAMPKAKSATRQQ